MNWEIHPLHTAKYGDGALRHFRGAEMLNIGKYSFLVMRTPLPEFGKGWELSWKDHENPFSVHHTIERGFDTKAAAKLRCEAIYRDLKRSTKTQ